MKNGFSLLALCGLMLFGCASAPPAVVDLTQPATLYKTGGPVYSLSWGPDGRLASALNAGVKVWKTQEDPGKAWPGPKGYVWGVAWSPDQKYLAAGGWDGLLNVWNGQTGELVKTFSVERFAFWCLSWSPDGSRIAAAGDNGTVKVYSLAAGEEKTIASGTQNMVVSVAWSPQGNSLVVGDVEGNLTLWSTDKWENVRTFIVESDRMRYDVNGAVWAPNGRWFATAHQDGWVRVWDPAQDTAVASFQQQKGMLRGISWGSDNRTLATGGEDGSVSIWDFPTKTLRMTSSPGPIGVWSVALSPDLSQLAAGTGIYNNSGEGDVLVWTSPPAPSR